MDDRTLIEGLQADGRTGLSRAMEVYAGYTAAVLGNTLKGRASREDLEELLSDVFLSLWRHRLELEAGEFHERVQKAYERLVRDNRRRFVVVDAARGVDEVAKDALDAVLERLLPDRRA